MGDPTEARSREASDGYGTVLRRVNVVGQMTYRRRRYSVGRAYRGRVASVREDGDHLDVTFEDRLAVRLALRVGDESKNNRRP